MNQNVSRSFETFDETDQSPSTESYDCFTVMWSIGVSTSPQFAAG